MLAHNFVVWWAAQLVSIAILLYFVLRWRPGFLGGKTIGETLTDALDARAAAIEEQLQAAQRSREEAERIRAESAREVEAARQQASEIVSRASQTSEAILREMEVRAAAEKDRIIRQARDEIDYERRQAELALRRRASEVAIDAAEQVIARTMDEQTDEQLIRRSLTQIRDIG